MNRGILVRVSKRRVDSGTPNILPSTLSVYCCFLLLEPPLLVGVEGGIVIVAAVGWIREGR